MCKIFSCQIHSFKASIDHAMLWSNTLIPQPSQPSLNVVNNRNGVIRAAPCEMAAQL